MYVTSTTDPAMMQSGAMGYSNQGIHNNGNPTHNSNSTGAIGHQSGGGTMRTGTTDRTSDTQDILSLSDRAVTAQTPLKTSGIKRQVPPIVTGIYNHQAQMAKLGL